MSDLFDLQGKAAIVTGGNGGIGLGIARGLADADADIAMVGRNEAKSNAAAAELAARGVSAIAVVADVTDKAAVTGMVERVERELEVIAGLDRHRSHQACACRGQRPARAGASGPIPTFASHSGEHLANAGIEGSLENI
jgi:NAD(P)-dependent dehydrogenase (short-subunit alcohol dehydrogenase family)